MNKQKQDIDSLSRELLQKSILKPESSDFDKRLMWKIESSPQPARWNAIDRNIKKGRFFLALAIVCYIATTAIVGEFLQDYFAKIETDLRNTAGYMVYGGLALSLLLVLYYLDELLYALNSSKKWSLN